MARRKANGKRDAALKREANKRAERERLARESALLVEVEREADNRDTDYQPPLELEEDEKSSEESDDVERARTNTLAATQVQLSGTPTATGTPAVGVIEEQAGVEVGSAKKKIPNERMARPESARRPYLRLPVSGTPPALTSRWTLRWIQGSSYSPSLSTHANLPGNKPTTINVDVMALREESEESSGGETEDTVRARFPEPHPAK
ncbi:hypothetical protein PLEOSDRAFT_171337 [Pleurotus ostreatus PC15]|uniref:Uncharacterized protein n=1 Tax=Pleurotus ostreatus (strain PC15) TaxID=1137138 RepID=A0A067N5K7_PLEO1|nr:hypothetical protein PLEOSDRAFT_171337 [Pleurotus ostreatus PC15]